MINVSPETIALVDSGTKEDLRKALQAAIELEHSTMPPYLYAMYSLGGENRDIAKVLMEILIDEMTHMLLNGNLLKAIGGDPVIYSAAFVPDYPTHLPGCVATDFTVPLKRFSLQVAEHVFMRIEQPEHVLEFREIALEGLSDTPSHTIGEFYRRVRGVFEEHGDEYIEDTTGESQPVSFDLDLDEERQRVTSKESALAAIDLIVEQGEGTNEYPFSPDADGNPVNNPLAHYYRFAELVKGRIKPNPEATPSSTPEERFVYDTSDPIRFEQSEVLPFPDNPKAANYDEGSDERNAIDGFNRKYTRMLELLHEAFNGAPARIDDAIDEMRDMHRAARKLYRDFNLGPTFEFLP